MKLLKLLLITAIVLFALSCKKPTELIQLDECIITPNGGTHLSGQAVTITNAEYGCTIHYTNDGSEPTEQSPVYSAPLIIPDFFPEGSTTGTLKARAYKSGFDPSYIVSASFTVTYFNTVATPHFSPLSGDITPTTEVNIFTTTLNAALYYTIDGSDPTESSTLYSGPLTFSTAGPVTVKAKAFKDNWNPSEIATTTFNIVVK